MPTIPGIQDINQKISLQRAEALAAYLEKKGIDGKRIAVKGECIDMLTSDPNNYSVTCQAELLLKIQKKTMIRKKIYLLLLLIPLLHGCKESDFNDLLDRQGDQRKELQELTDLCKKLNEDIYNLQVIVNTDRIGDNITHIEELADGAGYTISFLQKCSDYYP